MTRSRKTQAKTRAPAGKPSSVPGAKTSAEFRDEYDPGEEVKYLRGEITRLEGEREKYEKEQGGLLSLFRTLRETVETMEPPKVIYKPPTRKKVANPIVHVSHWCDWHEGAVQHSDEIEGFNEFTPELLRYRLRNCILDQLEWVELHRKNYQIDVSHDLFTGDLISGDIHEELRRTNEYPVPVQAIKAGDLVAEVVAMKAPHYKKVVVDFVTADNHSRLTHKPQSSEAGLNCWGYVTAHHAQARLANFSNVEFNIHPVIQKVVTVSRRRYLLTHGDRIRGWSGFPYYGIERKAGREAVRRMRKILADTDMVARKGGDYDPSLLLDKDRVGYHRMIMGHWHAPMAHPWFWIGGSASGTTAYDHQEGREAEPTQCAWFVHPFHGEFDRTNWHLRDDPVKATV